MVFDMSDGKGTKGKKGAKKRPQWGESKMRQAADDQNAAD